MPPKRVYNIITHGYLDFSSPVWDDFEESTIDLIKSLLHKDHLKRISG